MTTGDHEKKRQIVEEQHIEGSPQVSANGHRLNASRFRADLIAWGQENFRAFPWRETDDPYRILIAEVMLHRTKAPQVMAVYSTFLRRYPGVDELAKASREDLLAALASLGLRQRVEMLHAMAQEITNRFDARVPESKAELTSLSGVSDYIAGAVRCFARNEPEALIDTNTVRVVGRLFGLKTTDSSRRNPVFKDLHTRLVDPNEPRAYNYAMLDLAARVCTKVRPPDCHRCPVKRHCRYGNDPYTAKATQEACPI